VKIRESGMPVEKQWDSFFEPKPILEQLGISKTTMNIADFGAGYGTFTLPVAEMISGKVFAFDIEASLVRFIDKKAQKQNLSNVVTILRDFISEGSGLKDSSVDFVMLFNILHLEKPTKLLKEAYRILTPGGKVGIIHWNYDPETPRGPPMNIRLRPEQIRSWAESVGFVFVKQLDLKPYHYAIVLSKKP
jgi:ubiquinone/menaquinone biosynthesis C-methylase UbiE